LIKPENFNRPEHKPRILIAPLDWGLGHATRCIPIISALIKQNCTVIVAAETQIKALLQKEFPGIQCIPLKGYRVNYSHRQFWMPVKLLLQLPKITWRIYAENRWLKKTVKTHNINAVVADNRMGLFHKKIPCIYITHQLTIKTGNPFTESIAQKIHYHYINKFSACWVPDDAGDMNLAGSLSHPAILPKAPVMYIGPLSRFKRTTLENKYDCCIILSGPEPQRTVFEDLILKSLNKINGKVFIVRGLPGNTETPAIPQQQIEIKNHLAADELNKIILQSSLIISRCGYSTIMDLVKLQKKAALVPTPGQTEQEYLGRYLRANKLFYTVSQGRFSLPDAILNAISFEYNTGTAGTGDHETAVKNFLVTITAGNAGV
jgi:uncharacterized protein (TIGR00661 family)